MSLRAFLSLLLIVSALSACGSDSPLPSGQASPAGSTPAPLKAASLAAVQMNISSGPQSWVYANVLRASEAWVVSTTALSGAAAQTAAQTLSMRPDGWPAALPQGLYLWLSTAGYPTGSDSAGRTYLHGVWVLTWEGKGTVNLLTSENNGSGEQLLLDDSAHGRIVKLITSARKFPVVYVRATDPGDPVRNVKLWAPADDGAGLSLSPSSGLARGRVDGSLEPLPGAAEPIFHPRFLSHISEAGAGIPLRLMSFLKINQDAASWGNGDMEWSDRGDASYALGSFSVVDAQWTRYAVAGYRQKLGVPYEWLIELCNQTHNDLWIQVPHTASESLIRNLARLLAGKNGHAGLNPGLRVWFEYSNELWNSAPGYLAQFEQARSVAAQHFGVAPSAVTTQQRGWGAGHLQGQALAVFQDEWARWGGSADRLINVVSGFALSPDYNRAVLAAVRDIDPALAETLAISNYFGSESSREIFGLTDWAASDPSHWPDALVDQSKAALRRNLYRTYTSWQANARLAAETGIPLISYEGGQHLLPVGLGDSSDPVFQKFMSFLAFLERGPVMRQLLTEHYALWAAAGGRTVSLFTDIGASSYWGYWGAKEWLTDSRATAGKWDAFIAWTDTMRGVQAAQDTAAATTPAAPALLLDDQAIQGQAGQALAVTLQAQGGHGAVTLELIGGELPAGLSFQAGAGGTATISGTPLAAATASVIVRALDADKHPAYRVYTITIQPTITLIGEVHGPLAPPVRTARSRAQVGPACSVSTTTRLLMNGQIT
jgi:hypothetical protein